MSIYVQFFFIIIKTNKIIIIKININDFYKFIFDDFYLFYRYFFIISSYFGLKLVKLKKNRKAIT